MQHSLRDYRPSDYQIPHIEIDLDLDEQRTVVSSRMQLVPLRAGAPLKLDGSDLQLLSVRLDGELLTSEQYRLDDCHLELAPIEKPALLEISCAICPKDNHQLQGLYLSQTLLCTQCEAEGFRRITYFLDRPDVLSRWSVRLRGSQERFPYLLAGGDLIEQRTLEGGRHETYWVDPWPKPCYLFAIAAGALYEIRDHYTSSLSGRTTDLFLYCEPHNKDRLGFALEALKRAMRWDEEQFGREYDLSRFQIVAVDSFNMGAMENKGLNIFNAKCLLADPRATSDDEFRRIEAIIAHEYFHNWTGNRITCRDWFQLTLKEGLTVFRDQLFSASFHSPSVQRLEQVQTLFARQFSEDASAMAHPIQPLSYEDINNFYTPTVYEKGAEVIRMIHTLLGKERFRAGMDCYFKRHDAQAVTCEEFISALEGGSGCSLATMRRWYRHYRTPRVYFTRIFDGEQLTLTVKQEPTPASEGPSEPLCIPLALALWNGATAQKSGEQLLILEQWQQSWSFPLSYKPLVSIGRGLSAPVLIEGDHHPDELLQLAKIDDDPVSRWLSSTQLLKQLYFAYRSSGSLVASPWIELIQATLCDEALDLHTRALLVRVPHPQEILQWDPSWELDAAISFYDHLHQQVAASLEKPLWQLYITHHRTGQVGPRFEGSRQLKHAALEYLVWTEKPSLFEALWRQLQEADCMSDESAALKLLCSCPNEYQNLALELYSARWSDDNLTWPRWFASQASSRDPTTLERCTQLLDHPKLNLQIPNQARALIASFSHNTRLLHSYGRSDLDAGYQWLAKAVLKIDAFNSQLAAQFAKAFAVLPQLKGPRHDAMRRTIEQLLETTHLSVSTGEILRRCL